MQRNHRSNCQYPLDYQKSGRVPEKHLLLLIDYAKAFDCVDHCKLWEILQEMGIPDHLTCLLRKLYVGQKAAVRSRHEQQTDSKLGKEYIKAVWCHPAYLTSMKSTLWEMLNITSWNQDCQNYQQLQICRWYYPSERGRKWRGTRVSLWGWKKKVKKLA